MLSSLQQQHWAQHVHEGRLKTGPPAESEWGPHDWSVQAPLRFTRMAALPHCKLDLRLGVRVGLEGEHICGGSTPSRQWAAESERGPCDSSELSPTGSSPGQTTSLHVATSSVTHVDAIEAVSTPEPYWL